ncbi:Osmoprotectant import ATP-binding protein OsmV [Carnimonas sp. R-84981]|uniref:ABC transporter ATP-binding protein n=1 Tax=Carnimonas bestiolae TaxID=3402172 RepID=UPI003EDCA3B2
MIELDALSKVFPTSKGGDGVAAVDNVSLTVKKGELCVFLGPSGCGKTTTLKMINRLIEPSAGRVLIDGNDTAAMDKVELRRSLGYVIQQIGLFPNMTIEQNITVVPRMLGWSAKSMHERARELMTMVALEPNQYLSRYPRELSGGQQQRIGVIRALAADPPLLLMDEPFGAVDPVNRSVIQDEFLQMQRTLGKTVIMVSHDIDEAIKLGDKVALFRSGQLKQFAHPDRLLADPSDEFVRAFVGADHTLKRLLLISAGDAADDSPSSPLGTRVGDARARMDEEDRRYLVISDASGKGAGFVRRHDLRHVDDASTIDRYLREFSTSAEGGENLRVVLSRMYEYNTSWLPVIDDSGSFMGEVTQESIAAYLSTRHGADESSIKAPGVEI